MDGAVMLGAALIFVTLFRRLGLGATLGYIVGGAIIGPQFLGLVRDPESVMRVSEIGIAFLLFLVGLELHPSRLWRLRKDIFGLGLIQVLLCGAALAALMRFGLGFSPEASLALGMPLALSSTAQVLPMLRSSGELSHPRGERAFSVLLFQDLSIVPMITIIAAMSRAPADPSAPPGWLLVLYTAGAIVGLVLAGRFLINPLFRLVGRLGERELFVVAGLFAVIASASLMHSLHLSTALGAFIAGVVLAESPYRHELESDVDPFRSLLLGMFFLSVGMLLDFGVVAAQPWLVVGLAVAIIAIKALVIAAIARLFGMPAGRAIWLGLLLSQAGEFGFVLFGQAAAAQLITAGTASLMAAVVTLSMVSTPFLMRLTEWVLERIPEPDAALEGPEFSPETNAIVVGYGRFGQTVAQMLMAKRIPVTLIDSKPSQIELSEEFGTKVYYGDGTRIDLLRTAGAETAEAILFCQDGQGPGRATLEPILEAFPHARVLVRAYDRRQVIELDGLDLEFVQRELFESAVRMGRKALLSVGVAIREVDRVEAEYRARDCERLELQAATGDLHAASERMFAVGRALPDEAPAERD
ncbi:monovalent cation:proton antiporter-2 (CPA2) family protein [Sphingomonas sp.]|uniref:monovalent cation:proton antiporter-2 (CPA2) family protein n=1 Tax=Sphingomonas sp. TaxID=28214 RepID=UPI00286E3428|nr:monovalent cation:proton antiporter-2 (CPA2) family protein [Sphingomonas sp.]